MKKEIFYSLGLVTEDIKEDDLYVTVYPIELLSDYNGDINEEETIFVSNKNIDGEVVLSKVNKSVKIKAKWLPRGNPNRLTPPNICKGEKVELYQYADSDDFYWVSMLNEVNLRKNEKATYIFSNKKTIEDKTLLDKVYFWTVDTINKFIRLHTDDSDGEKTPYDIEIDTGEGIVTLQDGRGNTFYLESMKDTFTFKLNKDMNITVKRDVNINAKNNINITAGKVYNLKAGNTINSKTKTHNLNSDNTNAVMSNKYDVQLSKFAVHNNTAELMATLSELIDTIIAEQHIGNLGIPTALHPSSISAFKAVQDKIKSFI